MLVKEEMNSGNTFTKRNFFAFGRRPERFQKKSEKEFYFHKKF